MARGHRLPERLKFVQRVDYTDSDRAVLLPEGLQHPRADQHFDRGRGEANQTADAIAGERGYEPVATLRGDPSAVEAARVVARAGVMCSAGRIASTDEL